MRYNMCSSHIPLDARVLALETFDDVLLKKTGTIGNPSLIIRKPIFPAQGKLGI